MNFPLTLFFKAIEEDEPIDAYLYYLEERLPAEIKIKIKTAELFMVFQKK